MWNHLEKVHNITKLDAKSTLTQGNNGSHAILKSLDKVEDALVHGYNANSAIDDYKGC
jgi:hypothetical protein